MKRAYLIYAGGVAFVVGMFAYVAVISDFYWWEPVAWLPVGALWVRLFFRTRDLVRSRQRIHDMLTGIALAYNKDYDEWWSEDSARWPRPWNHHDLDGRYMEWLG